MEKIEIIGNVGFLESKENSYIVSVGINRRVKNQDDSYEDKTIWYRCIFSKEQNFQVGDRIFVRGSLLNNVYIDKNGIPAISNTVFPSERYIVSRKVVSADENDDSKESLPVEIGKEDMPY